MIVEMGECLYHFFMKERDKKYEPDLGTAVIQPNTPIIAGEFGSWKIVYTTGEYGLGSGGNIKIAWRWVSDGGVPQFDDPQAEGYTRITTTGDATIRASWHHRGYIRPKSTCMLLEVVAGALAANETVTIHLGDTALGSPGIRAQTYVESAFELFVLVDPTNSTDPRPIESRLILPVVAGETAQIACILPSQGVVNQPIEIFVKGEDRWRNPTPAPEDINYEWIGEGAVKIEDGRLWSKTAVSGHIRVTAGNFVCDSNPIVIKERPFALQRYWGDLHAQTEETTGVGTEDEYFSFGRDWARLDFMSHQGNDFQMDDAYWAHLNETTEKFDENGRFVVFPGYEWSANTPNGGDHNVIYRREGHPILRSSHWLIDTPASDLSPAHPADDFYRKLKRAVPLEEVLVCQHVGGRFANTRKYFDKELIQLVEVVSVWGVFEWILWDAIEAGHIVGVMGNSDGHHGRPGAEGPGMTEFGIENGLTCVLADSLTRDSVFDALKNRRCYATTGQRMLLDFSANGQPMGSIFDVTDGVLHLEATVTGTAPLESLQLFCGREVVGEIRPYSFTNLTQSNCIRISWQGSHERGGQRRVVWDGAVRLNGCEIVSAKTVAFDAVLDGIVQQSATEVTFSSSTTGDRDGLELMLGDARKGQIVFESAVGNTAVDLSDLTNQNPRRMVDFGGLDMQVTIERYPERLTERSLTLSKTVRLENQKLDKPLPYFVKATQADGHMAWASPIWVR